MKPLTVQHMSSVAVLVSWGISGCIGGSMLAACVGLYTVDVVASGPVEWKHLADTDHGISTNHAI